ESVVVVAECACCEHGCPVRSWCGWIHLQPARPCVCVAKAERAYVWCGLHQCMAIACGSGRRCPCLIGSPPYCWGVALLDVPLLLGVCVVLAVCLALCACAPLYVVLCSVDVFARAKQMLVCRVAPAVKRCDTCLWLLLGLCWLVVNAGEVLPWFFSVGSSGALPSRLRCIALVPCVLVRFPRTVGGCPGE
ncbi:hypothetical protein Taro_032146, partial [Colocasia esculenta]|nr:hypothetical protein [Colocasia esculenta]